MVTPDFREAAKSLQRAVVNRSDCRGKEDLLHVDLMEHREDHDCSEVEIKRAMAARRRSGLPLGWCWGDMEENPNGNSYNN
ncbi:hypothetical protein TIFTF001_033611 [Ficus carica]|uniref:Uncharacterized protein n=1 Tax=Ficus carica TaxID=3494 RepID=A0AA88DYJ5_FICCA|nr:hypothetical protein TIFTF001_033611 [Ficus carica]